MRGTACCPDKNLTGSSVAVLSSLMLNFGRGRKQRKNAFFTDKQPGFWRASPPHGGMPRREPMLAAEGRPRVRKPVAPGKGRHGPGAANAPLTGGGPALHPGTAVSRWLRRAQIARPPARRRAGRTPSRMRSGAPCPSPARTDRVAGGSLGGSASNTVPSGERRLEPLLPGAGAPARATAPRP